MQEKEKHPMTYALAPRRTTRRQRPLVEALEARTLLSVVNEVPLLGTFDLPYSVTSGPDGNLWYTTFSGEPGAYNPATGAETTVFTGMFGAYDIVTGPDGFLYMTRWDGTALLTKMDTTGQIVAEYDIGFGVTATALTVGPDNALWITGAGFVDDANGLSVHTPLVIRVTTDGSVQQFNAGPLNITGTDIVAASDALYIAGQTASVNYTDENGIPQIAQGESRVLRVTLDGTITAFDVGAGLAGVNSVAVAADGSIYYAQSIANFDGTASYEEVIGRFTINPDDTINLTRYVLSADTNVSYVQPNSLLAASDGNIWFSQQATQSVVRLTPGGTLTEFAIPSGFGWNLTTGPDGNIWFTIPMATALGQVDLSQLGGTIVASGLPIDAFAGVEFSGPVATFTSTLTDRTLADYAATINWGDGTVTAGTLSLADDGVTVLVDGVHTYATAGSFPVSVTISTAGVDDAVANTTANVLGNLIANGVNFTRPEDVAFTETVAVFYGAGSAADYTATIVWGDGTTTAGTIVATDAGFEVVGTHTYATQGNFLARVTISNATDSTTVVSAVQITDTPLTTTGMLLHANKGRVVVGTIALFSDDIDLTANDFTATIAWGDGTTSQGKVLATDQAGVFRVFGHHKYKLRGTYNVSVTISNLAEGVSSTATSLAIV